MDKSKFSLPPSGAAGISSPVDTGAACKLRRPVVRSKDTADVRSSIIASEAVLRTGSRLGWGRSVVTLPSQLT